MKEWKLYIPIIAALMGGAGWTVNEWSGVVKETAELKAKEELRIEYEKKYEGVITDYITLRATCESK